MKQNERLLVYAVTGFLAVILVVAVLFSREPGKGAGGTGKPAGLDELLGQNVPAADEKVAKDAGGAEVNRTGVPAPGEVAPLQPLMATPKPMLAADLVLQQLGVSRRDRMVRWVRAKQGDSLDLLVRRWCGARDPYLDDAKALNEDLVVLRVGQEVAVPWVDDEVLLAAIEAQKPKTLVATDAVVGGATPANGAPAPASNQQPAFAMPGVGGSTDGSAPRVPAAGTSYTVKPGDSLWRIAERTYGRKNADRMVPAIKEANPGLDDAVRIGQKIVLPADPAAKTADAPSGA